MTEADFQWDPNATQTYSADKNLTLYGSGNSFDKAGGKTFTMNAPSRTLGLQVVPSVENATTWSNEDVSSPAVFDIVRGSFVYDARAIATALYLTPLIDTQLTFRVRNDAEALIMGGMGSGNGVNVISAGYLNMTIENEGILAFTTCEFFGLSSIQSNSTTITVSDNAGMVVNATVLIDVTNATVNVSSSKNPALQWYVGIPGTQGEMRLTATNISFSGQSSSVLAGPLLSLADTKITTGDTANCTFGFGPITVTGNSQFILAPGTAKMEFAGQGDKLPFNFINGVYPQKLFEIKTPSGSGINGGEFVIQDPTGLSGANAMLTKGLIAIDGTVQTNMNRLSITNDGQYNHIKQKA